MRSQAKASSFGSPLRQRARLKRLLVAASSFALAFALGGYIAAAASAAPETTVSPVAFEPSPTSATIGGTVNPEGSKVSDCHFVYGIGSASGNTVPCDPLHPAINERQEIVVSASSGQFKLTFEAETTPDLPYNAAPATVQAALEGLASIGAGNVSVTGGPGGTAPYLVEFVEELSGTDLPQIQAEDGSTPLGGKVEVSTTKAGDEVVNEEQQITVSASGGQFRLSFQSETTGDLAVGISGEEVQAALEGLASIGAGNVAVSIENGYYFVTFQGTLAHQDVPQITAASGTEPLSGSVGVSTSRDGGLSGNVGVSAELSGLTPDTEYRYKLVATNADGTEESDEQFFRTLSEPEAPGSCPNEARREEQRLFPAECRAYEMVSPREKNNSNVTGEGTNIFAAADGDAASFISKGGFAGTTSSGRTGFTQYLSRRGAGGWSTKAITPTPPGEAFQVILGGTEHFFFSEDLRKAILWGYDLPEVTDDVANNDNLYSQDTESGALEAVTLATQQTGSLVPYYGAGETWGASADTAVVSFASATQLLPEATPGVRNAYEWDHGTLRLAGILPNGEVPSGGSTPPVYSTGQGYRATVSSDGSRVIFASPAEGNQQLYLRRDHADTVRVSESESTVPVAEPEAVELQWVSPNAHKLLFTTTSKLVDEDENEGRDLYLYTDGPAPASEGSNLELITHTGDVGPTGEGLLGASEDAGRIYFAATGDEAVHLWDHGETRSIARVASFNLHYRQLPGPMNSPGTSRVSADGRYLALQARPGVSFTNPAGEIGPTGKVVGNTRQMYVYDAVGNTLSCASCMAAGPTSGEVPYEPQAVLVGTFKGIQQLRPRYLSDDGRRVFFSTPEALLPEDTNGVMDTYAYDTRTGERRLISSGKGENGQWFVNASSSGDDAFFVTAEKLIGADPDGLVDLYDARVNGGFVEPPPPPTPCVGDGCRGPLSTPAGGASPASASFSGPGNPHRKKRRHHKKRHKKHRHRAKGATPKGARR